MRSQHLILGTVGLALLLSLYFFGRTTPPKKQIAASPETSKATVLSSEQVIQMSKQKLSAAQLTKVEQLENAVVRGDVKEQKIKTYGQLASYYRDSINALLPYAYYTAEAAKLESIEKKLTFAAHLFFDRLRDQPDPQLRNWMALQSKELFEKALEMNPGNDSNKVSLGSTYIFGNVGANPMDGILMIREVADRDPHNLYAQMMLGIGGVMTGQFDKAIDRFKKVVDHQPDNLEALLNLAEAYEQKGDKSSAIKWYEQCRKLIQNPEILKELDKRIQSLK